MRLNLARGSFFGFAAALSTLMAGLSNAQTFVYEYIGLPFDGIVDANAVAPNFYGDTGPIITGRLVISDPIFDTDPGWNFSANLHDGYTGYLSYTTNARNLNGLRSTLTFSDGRDELYKPRLNTGGFESPSSIRLNFDSQHNITEWDLDLQTAYPGLRIETSGNTSTGESREAINNYRADGVNEGGSFPPVSSSQFDNPGTWLRRFPDNLVVLTHGLQSAEETYISNRSYLPEVEAAIRQRLSSEFGNGEVDLILNNWEGAFRGVSGYEDALANTEQAGQALANRIDRHIRDVNASYRAAGVNGDYNPTIHLIGHSLGTVVTGEAVSVLHSRGVYVDQVTLLDTPKEISRDIALDLFPEDSLKRLIAGFDDALFFYDSMPSGSVGFVENFYSTRLFPTDGSDLSGRFGQPIAGAAPVYNGSLSGQPVDQDHNGIHRVFYSNLVRTSASWNTPVLGSSGPSWNPDPYRNNIVAYIRSLTGEETRIIINPFIFVLGNSEIISDWNMIAGQGESLSDGSYRIIAQSPAALEATLLTDDVLAVDFTFVMTDSDASLSVLIDGTEVWVADDFSGDASIDLLGYYGEVDIQWLYLSDVTGSSVDLSNLELTRIVSVPEPGTSLLLGVVSIILCRRRSSRR